MINVALYITTILNLTVFVLFTNWPLLITIDIIMNSIDVVILSIVEGVTEFLPISSTAHLILTSHILGLNQNSFLSTFEIAIQLGAILAVCFLYIRRILNDRKIILKSLAGFFPTGVIGFIFFDNIKSLLTSDIIPVVTLFFGGVAIIIIERIFGAREKKSLNLKTLEDLTYKDAFIIGLIQSISMVPGVSRAAASIFGTMSLGFSRKTAVEFAFLLAIPTMMAATGYDLMKSYESINSGNLGLLILGIVLSFIVAFTVAKWLLSYVQKNDFTLFGVYRIVFSLIYTFLFLL